MHPPTSIGGSDVQHPELMPYRVRDVRKATDGTDDAAWVITFVREPQDALIDLTVNAVVLDGVDPDRAYAVGDLINLREIGQIV